MKLALLHILLLGLTIVSGCSVNPVTGSSDLVLMSEDQEIALGRRGHQEILKKYREYNDVELSKYVQKVGERIAANSHRSDLVYRFTVLDSPEVNAFALPGGYIYVTRGILAYFNSEAELAAVLGHEIGHVTARHSVKQHSAQTFSSIASAVLAAGTGVRGVGDAANFLGTALVRGYGREHELEADRLGAAYLARTGYRPEAMLDVIRLLKNQETFEKELAKAENRKPRIYHGLFSTHPDNDTRLQSVVRESRRAVQSAGSIPDRRKIYLSQIDGMTYGDSQDQGILRGSSFYHRSLDFSLTFPANWSIKNQPNRIIAWSPKREGVLVLTMQDINRHISPQVFLRKHLNASSVKSGEAFTHQGLRGYTAFANVDTPFGKRFARATVVYHNKKAFVMIGAGKDVRRLYQYDPLFLKTAKSLHRLTGTEKLLSGERKLSIKTFKGEPYSELGASSGLSHLAESQIRLLNGDYPSGEPKPGSLIKVVE